MNVKVAVLLENDFEELEAMGPIALLRRGYRSFWRNLLKCLSNEYV